MIAPHRGKLLTIKQAAAYSGYSVRHLRELANSQAIAHVRQGDSIARRRAPSGRVHDCAIGRLFFLEHDLDEYIDQQRTPAKTANETSTPVLAGPDPLEAFMPPASERRFA